MHICNHRTYLLAQLKRQGLPQMQLQNVCNNSCSCTVCITCLVRWFECRKYWWFATVIYNSKAMANCHRQVWCISIFDKCDMALFKSSLDVNHCLHHLYLDKWHHVHSMTLWPRGHNLTLPKCRLQCTRNSFIDRISFAFYIV